MELQQSMRIADQGGSGYANIETCSFYIEKTFSGYELQFNFQVSCFSRKEDDHPSLFLQDLHVKLYFHQSDKKILLGQMATEINYQPRKIASNYEFSLKKNFFISTDDFIRLVNQTYGGDVLFGFEVVPVFSGQMRYEPTQQHGWLRIPQTIWLEKINALDLDRFELITIRVPVASSHLHKPFADAVEKIREAEKLYERGELLGAAVACRAAWNTVLSSVPPSTPRLEYMLAPLTGDPRRKAFAQAVLNGFHDVINKGVHLEGNVKTSTPPADLKPEDVLLCIHWYAAAIGYLSRI
jgi:hypothetical protein